MDFINNAILVHELQISLCYAKEAFSERTVLSFAVLYAFNNSLFTNRQASCSVIG